MTKEALLIGINRYGERSGLAPLRYAEADAAELARALAERCGFRARTLLGAAATGQAVQDALLTVEQAETFVFFFAGHGQDIRRQYCLHPVDSTASGIGVLPFETIARHFAWDFPGERVLILLDACRNELHRGGRGAGGFHAARDIERAAAGERLVEVLYGCSDGEVSYEEEELGHGVFTDALLKVLRADEGELDTQALANRANDLMRDWWRLSGRVQRAKRYHEPSERHRIVLRGSTSNGADSGFPGPIDSLDPPPAAVSPAGGVGAVEGARLVSDPVTDMPFLWVPGGEFVMGDFAGDGAQDERPPHRVRLDGFWLGRHPVTQREWELVMGGNPAHCRQGPRHPVEQVSWSDALEFIARLNRLSGKSYCLPTEAQWEYAARGGGREELWTAVGQVPVDEHAWYGTNAGGHSREVETRAPNALGLYDMSGNVWEWCADWYAADWYAASPVDNPVGPATGSKRVMRGGGWSSGRLALRTTRRCGGRPESRMINVGFRLALAVLCGDA